MRWPRFLSEFQIEAMFRELPNHPSFAPFVVSGFTQYKTQVSNLPASERAKLEAAVERIVAGTRPGKYPIVGALLVGHADQDLGRGHQFEREISLERAKRVLEELRRAVAARAGLGLPGALTRMVAMRAVGLGAARRVFVNPTGEAQRAANRRVEIFLAEANAPNSIELLEIPRQKHQEDEAAAPIARPGSERGRPLLAFSVPIFASPALAGAAVFTAGPPRRPAIKHDHGFLDDGKGNIDNSKRQQPTDTDLAHKDVWKLFLGLTIQNKPELKDATDAYKHFLVDNNGSTVTVDYNKFLTEDNNGKTVVNSAVDDARTGILDLFDAKFPKPATTASRDLLQATSTVVTVGRATPDFRYPYPASENWQKAIGGHALWLSAEAVIDSDPAANRRTVAISLTFHAEDMYNFNPGGADVATNTSDAENGRFEITGLGHEFLQTGTATRKILFTIPNAKQPNNRIVPGDQKVTT